MRLIAIKNFNRTAALISTLQCEYVGWRIVRQTLFSVIFCFDLCMHAYYDMYINLFAITRFAADIYCCSKRTGGVTYWLVTYWLML